MDRTIVSLFTLVLVGCGGDSFYSIPAPDAGAEAAPDADPGKDAASSETGADGDAAPDAPADVVTDGAMCVLESGKPACLAVVDAYCQKLVGCGGGAPWQNDLTQCKMHFDTCNGYIAKVTCKPVVDACVTSIGPVSQCTTYWNNTPETMPTGQCSSFWAGIQ